MSHRERDDDYGKIIAQLGSKFRLIECKDSIQWILQEKPRDRWLSLNYLTSREGVIHRVRGLPGWEVLNDLPSRFEPLARWRPSMAGAPT